MTYNPDIHHRRSIRLQDYDYSSAGAYFVTLCIQNHECLLGEIINGEMVFNDAGQMLEKWWWELQIKFPNVMLDEFIIMPNHFHGIVFLTGTVLYGHIGTESCGTTELTDKSQSGCLYRGTPTLGDTMDWFKTMTTNGYIRGVKQFNWRSFSGKFWQRNYYERVIRNENELTRAREYIINNPMKWDIDKENPYST